MSAVQFGAAASGLHGAQGLKELLTFDQGADLFDRHQGCPSKWLPECESASQRCLDTALL